MDAKVREAETALETTSSIDPVENGRPVRILHLSDLHFGAKFDAALWDYIHSVLAGSERPDVIAVTGDLVDTPSFFMLGVARRELQEMREKWRSDARACELVVIPGNHDVGILGNVSLWPWSVKFGIVFGADPHRCFDCLPTYGTYRSWKWYKRWWIRTKWSLAFAALRLTRQLKSADSGPLLQEAAGRRVCFACLNSNGQLMLASGRVDHASILQIHGELLRRRYPGKDRTLLSLVPRIALVHHHVVPIPYAGSIESPTEFEPFLVLRNAGTLLRELCEWDFDLILHGHKHFLNFARLTFDSADNAEREVAVLAAGTATSHQTGAGANSFNLVKVYPNGEIWFRSVRYGQGQSAQMGAAWDSGFQRLLRLEKLKRRVHGRAVVGQQICCDLKELDYTIDEDGSADVRVGVSGLRGTDEEKLRRRCEGFSVGFGAIDPLSVRLDDESLSAGHRIERLPEQPSGRIQFDVVLGGAYLGSENGVDYRLSCRFMNSFAITRWECRAMGQPDDRDWLAAVVRLPMKKLRLSLRLPPSLERPDPYVVVDRHVDFPLLQINSYGELDPHPDTAQWARDPDFTHVEKEQLKHVDGRWVLDVDYPLVGHRYLIKWSIGDTTPSATIERQCMALQLRRSLIELCNPVDQTVSRIAAFAAEMLGKVTEQVLRPLLKTQFAFHEKLDAALFVYDDTAGKLRVVASADPDELGAQVKEIPLNAGVGGSAFKSRRVKVYVCPQCAGKGGVYVYYPEHVPSEERTKFAALIAFPLHLGDVLSANVQSGADARVAPEEMIGVFTIGSTAFDSKLISLGGDDAETADAQQQQLTDEIWSIASRYLAGLSDEIRKAQNYD